MCKLFDEGNLRLDFTNCGKAERFDGSDKETPGMKAVDFIAETADCLFFIEVKDYQHPNAPPERRKKDLEMLKDAIREKDNKPIFALEMGAKIKDSLLRRYAEGKKFTKKVTYLLFINLDKLGASERGQLKEKLLGYVPVGLNDDRFAFFNKISFDLVNADQLEHRYSIICCEIARNKAGEECKVFG